MGAPPPVPHLRPRRLLRLVEEQACEQARVRDPPPDRRLVRARRELGVVLLRPGAAAAGVALRALADSSADTASAVRRSRAAVRRPTTPRPSSPRGRRGRPAIGPRPA